MRRLFSVVITAVGMAGILAVPAGAQQSGNTGPATQPQVNDVSDSGRFDLRPDLTQAQFDAFAAEAGRLLRFRQVGDATTLGRGGVELSAQFANMPFDDSRGVWTTAHHLGRKMSYPQVVARFGLGERVDLGAWGGFDPGARFGLAGIDTRIGILRQADGRPVSVLIRPSLVSLIYPSQVLVGTVGLDISVSRAFGPLSPYAGIGSSSSGAIERSNVVDLDPATANRSFAFAGLSYRWRAVVMSAELEKGARFTYAFRIGKRF